MKNWIYFHGVMLIALTGAAEIFHLYSLGGILIAVLGTGSMMIHFFRGGTKFFTIANILTVSRVLIAAGVLLYSSITGVYQPGYLLFCILCIAALSDLFDGPAARKYGKSSIGESLDAESDAFFLLILACLARFFGGYGLWVLAFGLIRYVFAFIYSSKVSLKNPAFRFYAKFACVCGSVVLVGLTAPFVPKEWKLYALYGALTFIVISFLLEGVLRLLAGRVNEK